MEIKLNIPEWLKIPLYILLPALVEAAPEPPEELAEAFEPLLSAITT